MNGGVIEESSKIAQTAINALNSVPVLLALVLLQFFILGAVTYLNLTREENLHARSMRIIERCIVPSGPRSENDLNEIQQATGNTPR